MFRPSRAAILILLVSLLPIALPVSAGRPFKNALLSIVRAPLTVSSAVAQEISDLFYYRRNASENKRLRKIAAEWRQQRFRNDEIILENERLTSLLEMKKSVPFTARHASAGRVIGKSMSPWSRVLLLDKGSRDGVTPNMLVLSDLALIGKIAYTGPAVSKVILLTDPNSKIGVLVQRTRQEGILYGTASGECRVKYLSADTELKSGDLVETAGFGFFPKGIPIGRIEKAWKEPGQIYQVARVKPLADITKAEEVLCVD